MKHQHLIDKFHTEGEWDGHYYIIYLGKAFWDVLKRTAKFGVYTDIIGAYLNPDGCELSFLIASPDDYDRTFATFSDFPYSVQKHIINYIKSI